MRQRLLHLIDMSQDAACHRCRIDAFVIAFKMMMLMVMVTTDDVLIVVKIEQAGRTLIATELVLLRAYPGA